MEDLFLVLIAFCIVILVVSLCYIYLTIRHKERALLIEHGKEVSELNNLKNPLSTLKFASLLLGAGFGLLLAFILDYYVFISIQDTEPLYPAMVLVGGGMGLYIFYRFSEKNSRAE